MTRPILALLTALLAAAPAAAEAPFPVGFRHVEIAAPDGGTMAVELWYPTAVPARPTQLGPFEMTLTPGAPPVAGRGRLVVISHGNGGDGWGHRDTAAALAAAGYAVAAPTHPRNNWRDNSGFALQAMWAARPQHLSAAIDWVLAAPDFAGRLAADKVGIIGHSAGGYTATMLLGASADMANLPAYCRRAGESRYCPEGGSRFRADGPSAIPPVPDRRIAAAVLLAPFAGFFDEGDFAAARAVPVRLYQGDADELLPLAGNAGFLAARLPGKPELVTLPGIGHFTFIAPPPPALAGNFGEAGRDPPGVDRAALHARLNPEIVAFFDKAL